MFKNQMRRVMAVGMLSFAVLSVGSVVSAAPISIDHSKYSIAPASDYLQGILPKGDFPTIESIPTEKMGGGCYALTKYVLEKVEDEGDNWLVTYKKVDE
ncbi:hypothetical protein AYJ08_08155 [Brevibacillus sp. SKDU10]|uniref:hypothetical protein n=1 Tax=Brevibacillus sp. SKDU10 TaxID=1247872 RepID=UPI0007C8DF63|nr:hypothetical protein [Brevibacillus sp. SKDU10]OAJ74596.1 hypothetical protein AYJ08_08155 [Brevibacillus sp. SKDU10]